LKKENQGLTIEGMIIETKKKRKKETPKTQNQIIMMKKTINKLAAYTLMVLGSIILLGCNDANNNTYNPNTSEKNLTLINNKKDKNVQPLYLEDILKLIKHKTNNNELIDEILNYDTIYIFKNNYASSLKTYKPHKITTHFEGNKKVMVITNKKYKNGAQKLKIIIPFAFDTIEQIIKAGKGWEIYYKNDSVEKIVPIEY